jgi:hypothetical protein
VVLTSQPGSNVVSNLTSSDTGEATVSPATPTFANGNGRVPQAVTITGVDDVLLNGNQVSTITVSVDDFNSDERGLALAPARTPDKAERADVSGAVCAELR